MAAHDLIYREHEPGAALRGHVQCLWEMNGDCTQASPHRIVPDGCMSLVLNFGAPAEQLLEAGVARPQPRTLVIGEMRRPIALQSRGRVDLVGVRFWPGALRAFLAEPVSGLVDRVTGDAPLGTALARRISRTVHDAEPADRLRLLQAALASELQTQSLTDDVVVTAVRALVHRQGRVRIDGLAEELGVSRRFLERRFVERVGIPPKSLANVLRFRRALSQIEARPDGWAEVSADCGYYDQSHLIRDFKRFTGFTPKAYRGDEPSATTSRSESGRPR